jgi:hypothetical protein
MNSIEIAEKLSGLADQLSEHPFSVIPGNRFSIAEVRAYELQLEKKWRARIDLAVLRFCETNEAPESPHECFLVRERLVWGALAVNQFPNRIVSGWSTETQTKWATVDTWITFGLLIFIYSRAMFWDGVLRGFAGGRGIPVMAEDELFIQIGANEDLSGGKMPR